MSSDVLLDPVESGPAPVVTDDCVVIAERDQVRPARTEADWVRLRRRRRVLLGAVGAVVALAVAEIGIGPLVHTQRQRHLAAEFIRPARDIAPGDALAVLQIPAIGLDQIVVEGGAATQLRGGPGHVLGTVRPGEIGNAVLLGHRWRYGRQFQRLDEVKVGATVAVQTRARVVRRYRVTQSRHVGAVVESLASTSDERLTLITSDGRGSWVVVATASIPAAPGEVAPNRAPPELGTGAIDERPLSGVGAAGLLVVMAAMPLLLIVGAIELRRRYSAATCALLLVPVSMGLIAVAVFALDSVLPATF